MTRPRPTAERREAEHLGRSAEAACIDSLQRGGWQVLATRFRPPRGQGAGEIDIVARRAATLAFIEVKARASTVAAAESLGARQQQRIARAAEVFLALNPDLAALDCRFDVMLVAADAPPAHLEDAWRPGW
ncbi:YraN family protein [Caenispirillum bisanense]|uniref:YraN family protein n=1 Tax=Caenispirillum bisanense TaxID=414052 RepID=UPI0031E44142